MSSGLLSYGSIMYNSNYLVEIVVSKLSLFTLYGSQFLGDATTSLDSFSSKLYDYVAGLGNWELENFKLLDMAGMLFQTQIRVVAWNGEGAWIGNDGGGYNREGTMIGSSIVSIN